MRFYVIDYRRWCKPSVLSAHAAQRLNAQVMLSY